MCLVCVLCCKFDVFFVFLREREREKKKKELFENSLFVFFLLFKRVEKK